MNLSRGVPRFAIMIVLIAGLLASASAQTRSAARTTVADTLTVKADPLELGRLGIGPRTGDDIADVVAGTPFQLIRRGATAASDVYVDGFKKGDVVVTVDGERFTTACPNRMDTRVGQVNLLDIEMVDLDRRGGGLQAGLGGGVAFTRRRPGAEPAIRGLVSGGFGAVEEVDAAVSAEARFTRISARYRRLEAWEDADGGTFTSRYGYADAPGSDIMEIQLAHAFTGGDALAGFETSRDVLFPYLLMDERENEHFSAAVGWRGHRLYVNYTDHVMDNGLRTSLAMTDMRTDATNLMAGVTADRYEVYVRRWDAENRIIPVANPMMQVSNRMLPETWRYGATVRHEFGDSTSVRLALRLGLVHSRVGDEAQASRYETLYQDADLQTWSIPFGATLGHSVTLAPGWDLGLQAEASSSAPGLEQLYISVDRPGTNPTWLGNPDLADPRRATVRAALQHEHWQAEIFATRVWDYVYPVRRMVNEQGFQTFAGIDAWLAGAHLGYRWRHVAATASWNWGEQVDSGAALAEIQPLSFTVTAQTPAVGSWVGRARYEHAMKQSRVDASLGEFATEAWNRVDLGIEGALAHWTVMLSVDNLLDETYAQHLSYLRNPFRAGVQVLEPGRSFRLAASFRY